MSYYADSDFDPDAPLDPQLEAEGVAYERAMVDYLAAREAVKALSPIASRETRYAVLDRYAKADLALRVWQDAQQMQALQPVDLPNAYRLPRTA